MNTVAHVSVKLYAAELLIPLPYLPLFSPITSSAYTYIVM